MAQRLLIDGEIVWRKAPEDIAVLRRLATRAWNAVAGVLDVQPLRTPLEPHAEDILATEVRRIETLRAQGVRVPPVLALEPDAVLLGDLGESLSRRLKDAASAAERDALVRIAAGAVLDAHQRGAYLGQPLPRNIAVDGGQIGFLDFEEDPLAIMDLDRAQARDWVMFVRGLGAHYPGEATALTAILAPVLAEARLPVRHEVRRIASRLRALPALLRPLGRSARALGTAIGALRGALGALLLFAVLIDWLPDRELDCLIFLDALP